MPSHFGTICHCDVHGASRASVSSQLQGPRCSDLALLSGICPDITLWGGTDRRNLEIKISKHITKIILLPLCTIMGLLFKNMLMLVTDVMVTLPTGG